MLELLWVSDPGEAQSDRTRRTRLWDRCERANTDVSPFGIIFRPSGTEPAAAPFPVWSYTPAYLPPGLAMQIADGTSLCEPELFYLPFMNRARVRSSEPVLHAVPIRGIRGVSVGVSRFDELSDASRAAQRRGLIRYFGSPQPVMEVSFEGAAGLNYDLRPDLPLIFRSAAALSSGP
jgi:hypothetical protein